eukprot:c13891_g1_i1.p1 GENE.c13891_g1_i1~~c13891_g1_i1.p1  ORF type:complete len:308 (-),score=74.61 c13891_g1_i1:198-1091(-)
MEVGRLTGLQQTFSTLDIASLQSALSTLSSTDALSISTRLGASATHFGLISPKTTVIAAKQLVKKCILAVIDATFVIENDLIDKDYPEPQADIVFVTLLPTIKTCMLLCAVLFDPTTPPPQQHRDDVSAALAFDCELVECFHFRIGHIVHCYIDHLTTKNITNTTNNNKTRFDTATTLCAEGIESLESMRQIRALTNDPTHSHTENELIHAGVFSDSHLIGLMFEASLCLFLIQITKTNTTTNHSHNKIHDVQYLADRGCKCANTYIYLVENVPTLAGWIIDQARKVQKQLMQYKQT